MNRQQTPDVAVALPVTAAIDRGGLELIDAIAAEWRGLCDEGPCDEPFYRPEWIRAYLRAFAPDRPVVLATARIGGRLAAVLPLVFETALLAGVPVRKLRYAGNVHTCRYDLVHGRGFGPGIVQCMWKALSETGGWDLLELRSVPRGGAAGQLARAARASGARVRAKRAPSSPYVPLTQGADAFEAMLVRLDSKFRSNLRRRRRKLEARGPIALVLSSGVDERLEQFYELERAGWKGRGGSAVASDPATRAFYDEVAAQAERFGYLAIYGLTSAEQMIAMHYGLMLHGRYYVLKTAFDETLRDCSPGQLVTHEVFRDVAARGCREFDFLGIAMDWKQDWAPRPRPHASWYIFRGAIGRLAEAARFTLAPPVARALKR